VRNVVVGTLPLILLIAATLLPLKMSAPVTQALAPFAVTWLLLSVASIFAPADVKKNFIKNLPSR
jgi:F0F1-type ATP synthase assembly protein I